MALGVKSIHRALADGAVKSRSVHIQGVAWAGEADTRVEVSSDAGVTWKPAQLGRQQSDAWRLWTYALQAPKTGDYTFMARATDSQGCAQPESAIWESKRIFVQRHRPGEDPCSS